MSRDLECPYCNYEYEACQDDGHLCCDGEQYKEECPNCEKLFLVYPCVSYSFNCYPSNCLNGGTVHNWGTRYYGTKTTKVCHDCGLEKDI